jgi:hypothetical protein
MKGLGPGSLPPLSDVASSIRSSSSSIKRSKTYQILDGNASSRIPSSAVSTINTKHSKSATNLHHDNRSVDGSSIDSNNLQGDLLSYQEGDGSRDYDSLVFSPFSTSATSKTSGVTNTNHIFSQHHHLHDYNNNNNSNNSISNTSNNNNKTSQFNLYNNQNHHHLNITSISEYETGRRGEEDDDDDNVNNKNNKKNNNLLLLENSNNLNNMNNNNKITTDNKNRKTQVNKSKNIHYSTSVLNNTNHNNDNNKDNNANNNDDNYSDAISISSNDTLDQVQDHRSIEDLVFITSRPFNIPFESKNCMVRYLFLFFNKN